MSFISRTFFVTTLIFFSLVFGVSVTEAETVSVSPSSVASGSGITVSWTAPSTHSNNDWVSIFAVGAPNTSYNSWAFVPTGSSGTVVITATDAGGGALPTGSYEVRYMLNSSFTEPSPAARAPITVTGGTTSTGFCGDAICSNGETSASCPNDCGTTTSTGVCGDGACNNGETSSSCPSDCGTTTTVAPPALFFGATPSVISAGDSTMLQWSASNVSSCTAASSDGSFTGSKPTAGSANFVNMAQGTYTYTLTCQNSAGSQVSSSAQLFVGPAPTPIVFFSATPSSIDFGGNTTLSWSSNNTVSCTGSGGDASWSGQNPKPTSGTITFNNLEVTTTYSIACVNKTGQSSQTQSQTVTVGAAPIPTIFFSATPSTLEAGGNTTLSWSSSDAVSCTGSGSDASWSGQNPKPTSGTVTFTSIQFTTTYSISCTNKVGVASPVQSQTVAVGPTLKFDANPAVIDAGGNVTLSWTASPNTTSCTAGGFAASIALPTGNALVSPPQSTTYSVTCSGNDSTFPPVTKTASVGVNPVFLKFETNPSFVNTNGTIIFTWKASSNAVSCSATGDWNATGLPQEGSHTFLNLLKTQRFAFTCITADSRSVSKSAEITVIPVPVITSFTASPTPVPFGDDLTVSWTTINATECSIGGVATASGFIGPFTTERQVIIRGLTESTTLTLLCKGELGGTTQDLPIIVEGTAPPIIPAINFTSDKTTVISGGSVTVTWSVVNTTKCVADGAAGWTGLVDISAGTHTKTITNLTSDTTLSLACFGIDGNTTKTIPVTVTGGPGASCSDKGGKCKFSTETCLGTKETAPDCTGGTICCVASGGTTSSGEWVTAPTGDGTGILINLIGSTMLGFWQAIPDGSGWQIIPGGSGSTAPVLNATGNLQIIPNADGSWQVLPASGSVTPVSSVEFAPNGTGGWSVVPKTGTASTGGNTGIGDGRCTGGCVPSSNGTCGSGSRPDGTCTSGTTCCVLDSTATPPTNSGPSTGDGLVPCGTGDVTGGNAQQAKDAAEDCQFEDFMALAKKVMDFLLFTIAVPIAAISFAWAGWLYMSAAGNESRVSEAHQIFKYVVLGLCVALAAWLIVNALVVGLGVKPAYNALQGGTFGG